jgi:tryptophanyl-tRNA synthetase
MTQFKDKASRMKQGNGTDMIPAGLFVYPPLMCADILLYDADIVPVGKDQLQHIELTRNVAERFNKKYGQTFKLPDAYRPRKAVPNILDLADTNHKMSKSRPPKGAIFLNDTMEDIEKKIKTALTDNFNKVKFDPINQPAISNLITIYSELADVEVEEIEKKFENIENYGVFKKELTKVVQEFISNFQTKYKAAMENIDHYLGLVAKNAKKCLEITEPKLLDIYKKVGLK